MSEVAEKPDLQERVGSAANASRLVLKAGAVGPADVLAAMGGAASELRDGWVNEAGKRVGKDRRAAELAPALWRLKAGGDGSLEQRAATLLAERVAESDERFRAREQARGEWPWPSASKVAAELVRKAEESMRRRLMAHQVIREWCTEACTHCGGVGKRAATGTKRNRLAAAARRHGAVLGKKLVHCEACSGTGRARVSDGARAQALGVGVEEFRTRWSRRFQRVENELRKVVGRLERPMAKRLRG